MLLENNFRKTILSTERILRMWRRRNRTLEEIIVFFIWDSLHGKLNGHFKAWSYKKKKYKKIKACRRSI